MNLSTLNQNNLKDKGWQKVKVMLDKEMPEKRKRRPVFWLFFGLILCLMASYLVWQLDGGVIEHKTVKNTQQKQFASNLDNLNDNNAISDKIVAPINELPSAQIKSSNDKSTSSEINKNRNEKMSSKVNELEITSVKPNVNVKDFQLETLNVTSSDKKEDLILNDQNRAVYETDNKSTIAQINIYTLPGIPFNLKHEASEIAMTSVKPIEKSSKKLEFDLFLTGGVGSYTYKDAELAFAGLRTNIRFSNRFSLGSGIVYHSLHTKSTQSVQEVNGANGNPVFTSPKEGFVLDGSAKNEDLFNPVNTPAELQSPTINKVSYFKLPILLEYKVYKLIDLYAGPQLNYLSKISSETTELISKESLNSITYNDKSIKRFYPSYTAGIRIKPWNRLSIDLSANYDKKIELSSNNTPISALAGLSFRLF